MKGFKLDSFAARQTASLNQRKAMIERFRALPGPDDPAVQARQAALKAASDEREKRRAERKAAKEKAMAEERSRIAAEAAAAAAAEAARRAEALALAAQQKSARDARYAARKARR